MVLFLSDIISRVFADAITIEVITVRNAISDKKKDGFSLSVALLLLSSRHVPTLTLM